MLLAVAVSILAGVSNVVSRIINSNLAQRIGIYQGTFFNYVTGLIVSSFFLVLSREQFGISFSKFNNIPLWAYFGGMMGVIVIFLSNYMSPRISTFYLTLFIFIGQLFFSLIIDYFISNTLSIGKVIGGALVLTGLVYNLSMDKKSKPSAESV